MSERPETRVGHYATLIRLELHRRNGEIAQQDGHTNSEIAEALCLPVNNNVTQGIRAGCRWLEDKGLVARDIRGTHNYGVRLTNPLTGDEVFILEALEPGARRWVEKNHAGNAEPQPGNRHRQPTDQGEVITGADSPEPTSKSGDLEAKVAAAAELLCLALAEQPGMEIRGKRQVMVNALRDHLGLPEDAYDLLSLATQRLVADGKVKHLNRKHAESTLRIVPEGVTEEFIHELKANRERNYRILGVSMPRSRNTRPAKWLEPYAEAFARLILLLLHEKGPAENARGWLAKDFRERLGLPNDERIRRAWSAAIHRLLKEGRVNREGDERTTTKLSLTSGLSPNEAALLEGSRESDLTLLRSLTGSESTSGSSPIDSGGGDAPTVGAQETGMGRKSEATAQTEGGNQVTTDDEHGEDPSLTEGQEAELDRIFGICWAAYQALASAAAKASRTTSNGRAVFDATEVIKSIGGVREIHWYLQEINAAKHQGPPNGASDAEAKESAQWWWVKPGVTEDAMRRALRKVVTNGRGPKSAKPEARNGEVAVSQVLPAEEVLERITGLVEDLGDRYAELQGRHDQALIELNEVSSDRDELRRERDKLLGVNAQLREELDKARSSSVRPAAVVNAGRVMDRVSKLLAGRHGNPHPGRNDA